MVSFLITGASRGIGLEFVRQLSDNSENTVFALVRNKSKANFLEPVAERPNVHVVQADVVSAEQLQQAAKEVAAITGGPLDVLIANAGANLGSGTSLANGDISQEALVQEVKDNFETNTISAILTHNAFLPLLRKGKHKKIIDISSAIGDTEFTKITEFEYFAPYGISKAALNFVVQKYAVELSPEGFTVLAISPGLVDTFGTKEGPPPTEKEINAMSVFFDKWIKASPGWDRKPITVQESVSRQLKVIHSAGPKDTGSFVSQNGNRDWL